MSDRSLPTTWGSVPVSIVSMCLSLHCLKKFCLSPCFSVSRCLDEFFCLICLNHTVFTTLNLNVSICHCLDFESLCAACLSLSLNESQCLSLNESQFSQSWFFFVSIVTKMSHRNCTFSLWGFHLRVLVAVFDFFLDRKWVEWRCLVLLFLQWGDVNERMQFGQFWSQGCPAGFPNKPMIWWHCPSSSCSVEDWTKWPFPCWASWSARNKEWQQSHSLEKGFCWVRKCPTSQHGCPWAMV